MQDDKKSSSVCRVCLSYDSLEEDSKAVSLFEMYNDCVISEKINALTNVDIKQGDGFPEKICPVCLLELENAYKFKLKCENTNEVLLSAVNDDASSNTECDPDVPLKEEYLDPDVPVKEEYLDRDDGDYVEQDDNISLADLQTSNSLEEEPPALTPKPSKAIDLKLECHDCGGSFKSKCKLRVHWKKVHLTENLKCEKCLRKFKSFAAFKTHKKQNLKSCIIASKVRIEGEGKNRIFFCKDCNYQSKRIINVGAHIVIHSGEKPFQCDLCQKYFSQRSSVEAHKENKHKVFKVEGTCHHCGKHIKGRDKLYKHVKSHTQFKRYSCKICDAKLKTKVSLSDHLKRHSGVKAYTCEICSASFLTASGLWSHRNRVHLKIFKSKKYTCLTCKYTSLSRSHMKMHQGKHTDSNFGCNVCGILVDNENQLELHKKRHTERNYPCMHCDKTYYSGKNLSKHVRDKHKIFVLNVSQTRKSSKSECSAKS